MRFSVLATDYDNTLASGGRVADASWEALKRLRRAGRELVLVTGRQLDDLLTLCTDVRVFSRIVAENGGVLYRPDTGERRALAPPPPPGFVDALRARGITHLGVGQTLVDTMHPNERIVLETIRELGLDLHIVFNGDAVMVVAPGVNKASGLAAALHDLGLSARNAVAVGDAENDHALLKAAELGVAVANAAPSLRARADFTLEVANGAGVVALVDEIVESDLAARPQKKRQLRLGTRPKGAEKPAETGTESGTGKAADKAPGKGARKAAGKAADKASTSAKTSVKTSAKGADKAAAKPSGKASAKASDKATAHAANNAAPQAVTEAAPNAAPEDVTLPLPVGAMLLIGPSASGKSKLTQAVLEQLADFGYQFCVFDPEGDHDGLEGAIRLGDERAAPSTDALASVLAHPTLSVSLNFMAVPFADRPGLCARMVGSLQSLQTGTGRPHWLIFDEAPHLFVPDAAGVQIPALPPGLSALYVTPHVDGLPDTLLATIDTVVAAGEDAGAALARFAQRRGIEPPRTTQPCEDGAMLLWRPDEKGNAQPECFIPARARQRHRRHVRKYAQGMLVPERSFWFRGPKGELNLRAHNLVLFVELAQGVDDVTWTFHLERGDYARWFCDVIGDRELEREAQEAQHDGADPTRSRARICEAIVQRYTMPEIPTMPDVLATRQPPN